MAYSPLELTPAQAEFLAGNIRAFVESRWEVSHAGNAGSDRRFLRVKNRDDGDLSYVLVLWDSRDGDWERFLVMARELAGTVPFLPRIYAHDDVHGLILEEDLGATTLGDFCRRHGDREDLVEGAYRQALDALVQWQGMDVATSKTIASRAMDQEVFLWESWYFGRYCVSGFFGADNLLNDEWEAQRARIAIEAAALPRVCIHRDFQSENILLHGGAVRFVDFQGARLGPAGYDLASLLLDPYADQMEDGLRSRLLVYFRSKSPAALSGEAFHICALQRLMQALGAYGYLSVHKGKERYRRFIPIALRRCLRIAEAMPQFPRLLQVLQSCRGMLDG